MSNISIKQVDETIKKVFGDSKVGSVESVYEKTKSGDFLKLVISLHNLIFEDTLVIHTKFVFKCNLQKTELIDNMFMYLYDYKCSYKQVNFDNQDDLEDKLIDIVNSNLFGSYLKEMGELLDSPASKINFYLKSQDIENTSVFTVSYTPKFKITPCEEVTFDFNINVQDKYNIDLNINLEDGEFYFTYKYAENIIDKKISDIKNLPKIIANHLIEILEI